MPVNYEVKGHLARLLATENLIVENKNVSTACFDVGRRILTLPMWNRASSFVYDLLVSHEVGHALFTPANEEEWDIKDIPRSYINITEDARVEKLMKRRYAGLAKTFYRGYKELSETDFFSVKDTDISKMSFADRVNLYFKIGNFNDITFSIEEKVIVDLVGNAETFQDAVDAARLIYEHAKNQKQQEKVDDIEANAESGGSNGGNSASEFPSESGNESSNNESSSESPEETSGEMNDDKSGGSAGSSNNMDAVTDDIFEEKSKEFNTDTYENNYVHIPNLPLEHYCVSNQEVSEIIAGHFACFEEKAFTYADRGLFNFIESSKKEVAYLVKEFECKKSADAYARSSVSKTGVLDCTKLHTYKFNDDLFKKVTVIPDGKNHGLIFVLDWSGSMGNILLDTVKQLVNLISFCRKVNIPFDVYLFTNCWSDIDWSEVYSSRRDYLDSNFIEGDVFIEQSFKMINIITSSAKSKDIDNSIKNLWRLSYAHGMYADYSVPAQLQLSGTPLNEAVVSLHKIIPHFTSKNKLQKVNVVILTDGESAVSHMVVKPDSYFSKKLGINTCGQNTYLRNRKTGEVRKLGNWWVQTNAFLSDLSSTHPQVNIIGIRLLSNREWSSFCSVWVTDESEKVKVQKQWKQNSSAVIRQEGFDAFFALACNALNNDVEFVVGDDASKSQIRSAFKKSLRSKALNKKILSEFIQLVV